MTFATWTDSIINLINVVVVPIIFGLTFLVFVYGVVKFLFLSADSEEGRTQGRSFILWGILGMVLLFGVWGVVKLLITTLGFG